MDLPAASQQIVPMATGFDPHPYPYPVVEPSNDCRDEAVANSFCLEEDMLALYEAFYPISSSDHHGLTGAYPPPPPHPCLWDETGSRHQLETLQSLQAQQEFQARQQNYYSWPEQHQHHRLQLQQQVVPRKGTAIRKKKKTDQLKTVYRVPAENILNVDKWAWRKYGQKPIKGSPFPRNYYRCSSSKGCAARKQVERSLSEPQVYVVTYTGDHFHPWPLHRNALAGISRSSSHHHNNTLCSPSDPPPPPPPPPQPQEKEEEEEEEEEGEAVLMIPNSKYVDEDMLRGMHDLANSKLINDLPTFY